MTTRPRADTRARRGRRRGPGARRDRRARPRHRRLRQRHVPEGLRLARVRCPTDHVCVTPIVPHADGAGERRRGLAPQPDRRPYGPNTCVNGYVWRAAVANDHVCVVAAAAPAGAQRQRPGRGPARRRCTSGSPSTARPSSRAPAIRARRAPTTRSASASAPTTSTSARRPCSCAAPTPAREKIWRPAGHPESRARRAACSSSPAGSCAAPAPRTRTSRCATPPRCAGRPASASRTGCATHLGGPSARRRPCGKGAGGAPRCLVQAAAGRNGAAWAQTRRQAGALSRGRRARLCRVWRGPIRMPSAAPLRQCGSPVCERCG